MAHDTASDDFNLVQQIADRDQEALSALYTRYSKPVFNLALYVLQNRTLAEEITQDVFFLLWQSPNKWNPDKGALGSWLLSVTRYMGIDRLRMEKSRRTDTAEPLDAIAERLDIKSALVSPEDTTLLRSLLKRLPKDQREVLFLSYFRGMKNQEIARQLNTPEGTVKSRLRLSLGKLREWWHEEVNEQI
jgi:RNA polymerase sigma-70 factor (ECF subfamily)